MLNVTRCRVPDEKRALFQSLRPQNQAWIVSDLQSKWHLQRELLEREGVLEEQAVLRATELWRHFAFQLMPALRILSVELAQTVFWNWIEPLNLPWARSPRAVSILLKQMQMWMSIFADPQHVEVMAQWFAANQDSYVRWGHWFELCSQIWKRCQEENLVMVSWLPALILNQDLDDLRWKRDLTFDLGPQMTQVEGLLVRELARRFDVNVIFPEVPWIELMQNTLSAYEPLLDKKPAGAGDWQPARDANCGFGRFSTQLAEVKDAVAQVREWLDAGVPAAKIGVIAPDIEEHWPALKLYFQQEGIPVNKETTARLGSFADMAQWLASLRTSFRKVSSADLELHFFTGRRRPRLPFDDFRVLFTNVYDDMDMNRARGLFESETPPSEAHGVQEFLAWGLRYWDSSADTEHLLSLLKVIGREVPRDLALRPAQWLSYLEGLLAGREVTLEYGSEAGVWCVSLSSVDWLAISHCLILNLCENALRRTDPTPMSQGEARKIFADTGFALGSADRQELEFEFLWFLNRPWSDVRLNVATTDFKGGVQTPSRLWMWAAMVNEKLLEESQAPRSTRWDEVQHGSLPSICALRAWNEKHAAGLKTGFERDLSIAVSTWKPSTQMKISASGLETFWNCPFQFAAQRKLKLSDDPALDLDLDRRTRGNLLHGLVEELLQEPIRWDWSDDELKGLVDRVRERLEIQVGDERLWPAVRRQHVRLCRLFLEFEKSWRERFPNTQTVGRELGFECYWDLDAGSPTAQQTDVLLSGRLDRVDRDSKGQYALVDYKGSSGSLRNWQSWLKNREIQLALYANLLEDGFLGLERGDVVAANYFVVKDSDRRKGFHLAADDSELYSVADKHRNFINAVDKKQLFSMLREEMQAAIAAIQRGELNPKPANEKDCAACSWRTLCRAPHHN